jgi:hypothetical protein
MKSIIFFLIFSITGYAQNSEEYAKKLHHNLPGEKVYIESEVDVKPKLMYGENAMYRFMSRSFKFPNEPAIPKIVCSFVIELDGTISDIKVVNNISESYKKEAIRVLNLFKEPWYPAVKNNQQVRCQIIYPIQFDRL